VEFIVGISAATVIAAVGILKAKKNFAPHAKQKLMPYVAAASGKFGDIYIKVARTIEAKMEARQDVAAERKHKKQAAERKHKKQSALKTE
jgi:hypothetical protein